MANERVSINQVWIELDGSLEAFDGLFLSRFSTICCSHKTCIQYNYTYSRMGYACCVPMVCLASCVCMQIQIHALHWED